MGSSGASSGGGGGLAAIYGDGSDLGPTFDGSSVVLGLTPSTNVYTLTRDLYMTTPTINNGVTIITAGYRIFTTGILTNNGTISWNGNNGNVNTGGASLQAASGSFNQGVLGPAGANSSVGSAGATGTNSLANALGGRGGTGGTGTSGAGGAGGTLFAPGAGIQMPRSFPLALLGMALNGTLSFVNCGASSGGGSGGGDAGNAGGGGGGGGGIVIVIASKIAGTGSIQARGGNGATHAAGNTGGGAGGGGGVVIVVSGSATTGAVAGQTIDANGGALANGNGTGTASTAGNAGTVILLGG